MQRNDQLLHRVGKAEHRSNQAEGCHNTAAGHARSRDHGHTQHHNERGEHEERGHDTAGNHNTHRAKYEADGIAVQVDCCAKRNDEVGDVFIYVIVVSALKCNWDGRRRGLRTQCGKVCWNNVFHAAEVVLAADHTGKAELREDIQQLQHNDDAVERGEHLDGGEQAAFGCDIAEKAGNVHRDKWDNDVLEHGRNDFLQIAADVKQGRAAQIGHADAQYKGEHQCGHNAEHRRKFNREKRFKCVAFQHVARNRLNQRRQDRSTNEIGQKTRYDCRTVGQQQRDAEQAVCLFAKLRHANRDKRQNDQRDHKGQEVGKQRRKGSKRADNSDEAGRVSDAEPAAAQTDERTGNNADNQTNQ